MWRDNPNVQQILEFGELGELRRSIDWLRFGTGTSYEQIRRALELPTQAFFEMMRELDHEPIDSPGRHTLEKTHEDSHVKHNRRP